MLNKSRIMRSSIFMVIVLILVISIITIIFFVLFRFNYFKLNLFYIIIQILSYIFIEIIIYYSLEYFIEKLKDKNKIKNNYIENIKKEIKKNYLGLFTLKNHLKYDESNLYFIKEKIENSFSNIIWEEKSDEIKLNYLGKKLYNKIKEFYLEIEEIKNFEINQNNLVKFREKLNNIIEKQKVLINELNIEYNIEGENFRIVDFNEIIQDWGWDKNKLLDKLIELDNETMEGLIPDMEGTTGQWADVFKENPETYRLLVSKENEIIGYWHFVSLFDEYFDLAKKGKLLDSNITEDIVNPINLPGEYNIYFVSICLKIEYRHSELTIKLWKSIFEVFTEFARNGIYINEIVTNAITPSGEAFSRKFGLNFICNHEEKGKIYGRKFYPFNEMDKKLWLNNFKELKELYEKKYVEKLD